VLSASWLRAPKTTASPFPCSLSGVVNPLAEGHKDKEGFGGGGEGFNGDLPSFGLTEALGPNSVVGFYNEWGVHDIYGMLEANHPGGVQMLTHLFKGTVGEYDRPNGPSNPNNSNTLSY
jgi:hypothetical protein